MNASQRQEFCVRWNSHLCSIGAAFPQLLAGQRFVDVTLACEGHQVHCHRLVLAACSSYFESILAENPCKHPVIILPSEVKLWEIQALVDFMYKGEVNVTQAGLPQLLRCAEQLRIRGLYGSDAALNLDQLKALTSKANVSTPRSGNSRSGNINDGNETDTDTATNSTSTTTGTGSAGGPQTNAGGRNNRSSGNLSLKQEMPEHHVNSNGGSEHHQQQHGPQQHHQFVKDEVVVSQQRNNSLNTTANTGFAPNVSTEDDSGDDSASNAYDQYDDQNIADMKSNQMDTTVGVGHIMQHSNVMDANLDDDHNYVAAQEDEEDNFADQDAESSANTSNIQQNIDTSSASFKRVRRSEASLEQAAKCVSKGQTFQTVSNMFNIPVSTIRFYMARKGILPKRKRGRGAATASSSSGPATVNTSNMNNTTLVSQALVDLKHRSTGSPAILMDSQYQMMGYKMSGGEQAHMI